MCLQLALQTLDAWKDEPDAFGIGTVKIALKLISEKRKISPYFFLLLGSVLTRVKMNSSVDEKLIQNFTKVTI